MKECSLLWMFCWCVLLVFGMLVEHVTWVARRKACSLRLWLQWGNRVIWTLNLGGNFGGEQQPNSKMHQVHRLTRINRFTDFRVRLMVTVILVHANSNKKGNTSDRAVGDKVQGDSLWRTLHKATNMDSENSGLFRKFIDLGLRRFYNDVDDVSRKISGR